MSIVTPSRHPSHREMLATLASFQKPSTLRSVWQLASTLFCYLGVNAAMYAVVPWSAWMSVPLAIVAGGLLVRLFIVQHDCGHGSYFHSRRANDALGHFCSVLTFTPYAFWRRQHAHHHASFNNLDRRDAGLDLYSSCATLNEYQALSRWQRLVFRAARHPLLTQLILPPFVFLVLYRLPFDAPRSWKRERHSVYLTNLALASVLGALVWAFGLWAVVMTQVPIVVVASIVGVWLFSVQHRFEDALWTRQENWSLAGASLEGSSYLALPPILRWFTGNIGFHHVHHLAPRVPNYRLQKCHEAHPQLHGVTTLTLRQAITSPFHVLWDEERGRLVPFPSRRPARRSKDTVRILLARMTGKRCVQRAASELGASMAKTNHADRG